MRRAFFIFFFAFSVLLSIQKVEAAPKGRVFVGEGKLFAAKGDLITIDLGEKQGLLKGDVLRIYKKGRFLNNLVAECIVVETSLARSVCEITKSTCELESGDVAFVDELQMFDEKLGNFVISVLKHVLDPYSPEKAISVFVRGIFDQENRVTSFSQILSKEFYNIASQKRKIRLIQKEEATKLKERIHYPDRYFKIGTDFYHEEEVKDLKTTIERANVDVVILGSYRKDGETIVVDIYCIDRKFGEKKVTGRFPLREYERHLNEVIVPKIPLKVPAIHEVKISFKRHHYFPTSHEYMEIAKKESDLDLDFRNTIFIKKVKFDRISPENIVFVLNGRKIKIKEDEEVSFFLEAGTHNLSVLFQPSFYQGAELLYTSGRQIKKEMLFVLGEDKEKPPLHIFVTLRYDPSRDNIVFEVIRKEKVVPKKFEKIGVIKEQKDPVSVYVD